MSTLVSIILMLWFFDANLLLDGIVNVSAKDKSTNKDQSMTIAFSSGLSSKDIEKMVSDAERGLTRPDAP